MKLDFLKQQHRGFIPTQELHQLVKEVQKEWDEEKILKIINSTIPLMISISTKYAFSNTHYEELLALSYETVHDCIFQWNPEKGMKFIVFVNRNIRWACGKERLAQHEAVMRRERDPEFVLEHYCISSESLFNRIEYNSDLEYLNKLIATLNDDDERMVINDYYIDGVENDNVIGANRDLSQSWTQALRTNGLRKLRYEYLRDLGYTPEGNSEIKQYKRRRKEVSTAGIVTRMLRKEAEKKKIKVDKIAQNGYHAAYRFYYEKDSEYPELFGVDIQINLEAYQKKYIPKLLETVIYHIEKQNKVNRKKIKKLLGENYKIEKAEKAENE